MQDESHREFWNSVTSAVESAGGPFARMSVFLTPAAVGGPGFDIESLTFLTDTERSALSSQVQQFLRIVDELPDPDAPATLDLHERGLSRLVEIWNMLRRTTDGDLRYGDVDAWRIGRLIDQRLEGHRPDWLRKWSYETGPDVGGDPALFVTAVVDDAQVAGGDSLLEVDDAIYALFQSALEAVDPARYLYVRWWPESEQGEADGDTRLAAVSGASA